ncbi:MAG: hypothetical protein QXG39_07520 [Candidatus Aenigmatarchaeota archaeon]
MDWSRYGEIIKQQFFFGKVYPFPEERDEVYLFASKDFFSKIGIGYKIIEVEFMPLLKEGKWYKCYLCRSEMPHQLFLSYDELAGLQLQNIFYASSNWYSEFSLFPSPMNLILKIPAEYLLTSKFKS